jgi:outer membrane protein
MTRKLATIAFVVLAFALALAAQTTPGSAAPAGPAPTKIGFVNIQQAIVATNEGQRDFQNLEKHFEPQRSKLQKDNAEVDELKKQLQTQGDHLNDNARADLAKNIEGKQKILQRNLEDAQADWQSQQGDIASRIGSKMIEVIDKYARANGYAVILDVSSQNSPVLWANETVNLTKAIVDAYNAQSNVPPPPATASSTPAKTGTATKPAGTSATPKQ